VGILPLGVRAKGPQVYRGDCETGLRKTLCKGVSDSGQFSGCLECRAGQFDSGDMTDRRINF